MVEKPGWKYFEEWIEGLIAKNQNIDKIVTDNSSNDATILREFWKQKVKIGVYKNIIREPKLWIEKAKLLKQEAKDG